MQTPVAQAQTAAPQAPTPPASPIVVVRGAPGAQTITIPAVRSAADLEALQERRSELSSQLTSVDGLVASTSAGPMVAGLGSGQFLALSIVFTVCVLGPLAVGFARSVLKRPGTPALPPPIFNETAQRLERVEAAVDTIALEIERISEGQRFVTKLLSETQPAPKLGAGQRAADPVRSS